MKVLIATAMFVAAAGCTAARSYRLPLDAASARATLAPIASVVARRGLHSVEHPDSIHVQLDDATWIQFVIQTEYNMVIVVNEHVAPVNELDRRFLAAKAAGDEIWQEALASMGAAAQLDSVGATSRQTP